MRPASILLDTCAAIWAADGGGLSASASQVINEAAATGLPIFVSPITAWEIGLLVSLGRVALPVEPKTWFATLLADGLTLARLTPDILVESSFLPSCKLRDPADRILAATARAGDFRLMTRDRRLLDYAAAGHMQAIAC